ncbi:MAG: NIF family HAD-type phosphatase [Bdellovibrionota bacterium]|nr:NIF family HAD-type phosphatase [Bdellovibrionota bacterium]
MRFIYFVFSLFLLSNSWGAIDLVFDIDYTLVQEVEPGTPKALKLKADGKYYRVHDWAIEVLDNLRYQNVNISFFSGGSEARNLEILGLIKFPSDQKSFRDIAKHIFSFQHLEEVAKEGKFGERYKKNLKRLGFDLKKTLLIDDYINFVPKSQLQNQLYIGRTYHYFSSYQEGVSQIGRGTYEAKYIPHSQESWLIAKNKLKFVGELVLDALEEASESEFLNFIHRNRARYIPYAEMLQGRFKNLFQQGRSLGVCFRHASILRYKKN